MRDVSEARRPWWAGGMVVALLLSGGSCGSGGDGQPLAPSDPLLPGGVESRLEVFPSSAELLLDPPTNTVILYAIVRNPEGRALMGRDPSFASDDPDIATVDSAGKVTARSLGTAEITVSAFVDGERRAATARVDVVEPPVAVQLAFESSPGPATAGAALDRVRVAARDSRGRTVATFEGRVDLTLVVGSGSSTRDLASTWAVEGIATFEDLLVRDAGDGYVLRATSEGLTAATSAPFDVAPAPAGRIAFVSDREGTPKIYLTDAGGSGVRRLTSGPEDSRPSWSPDGSRLAFARAGDSATCGIYTIEADGSNLMRLTAACGDITPAWSPDGARIAFAKWTLGSLSTGVYVMNADGSGVTRLTEGLHDEYPAWSPDGGRIAFNHTTEDENGWFTQVYVMNANGTDVRRLTDTGPRQFAESGPAWSADGSTILFWSFGYGIATVSASGGAPTMLYKGTSDPFAHPDVHYYSTPDWSPDGSYVVFAAGALGRRALYISRASPGRSPHALSTGSVGEDYEPAWTGSNP